MFSLSGGSIHKTRVAYGCVLLLGSASVAGVAVGDSNGQWFSTIGTKIQDIFAGGGSGSSTSSSSQENGLVTAGKWIAETSKNVFNWTLKPAAVAFSQIHKTYKQWWTGLKTFFGSLVKPQMYKLLFERFHSKIYNILSFFLAGGPARASFIELFKTTKLADTLKVGKFLFGVEADWSGKFRAHADLFNYLLAKWLDEPEKVTKKFDRLVKTIKESFDKLKTQQSWTSKGSDGAGGQDTIYTLDTETIDQYLRIQEGLPESIWTIGWKAEVLAKITTGQPLGTARNLFAIVGSLFSSNRGK